MPKLGTIVYYKRPASNAEGYEVKAAIISEVNASGDAPGDYLCNLAVFTNAGMEVRVDAAQGDAVGQWNFIPAPVA